MADSIIVTSPFDGSVIQEVPLSSKADVNKALQVANEVFQDKSKWIPKHQRIVILEKIIELMSSRKEELIKIAVSEGGKPYKDSKVEVDRAINGVKLAIEHIAHQKGEQIPMGHTISSANRLAYTFREPLGVVSSISAFNHPLNLIIHQTIPAIATGCPVIIKPASSTPLSCITLVNLYYEAGLPKEWCQVLVVKNSDAEELVTSSIVKYLSFIGSAKVGWMLKSKLNPGAHCALEHGGVAPVIVEKDADIDDMLPLLAKGGFYHAGQVCVSVQRVYVHESIIDKVANGLVAISKTLKTGDPLDPDTDVGPLISTGEVDRVHQWVLEAKEHGAQILCGGEKISDTLYSPTVILHAPEDITISQQEVFGPVILLYSFTNRNDAIDRANALPYSFQASVFTKNIDNALDAVNNLKAAAVMVNDHTAFRVDWMPFGGYEQSGYGIGGIPYTMDEMTKHKLMVIKSSIL